MKKIIVLVLLFAFVLCIPINADPGDKDDPIIVLSYLNLKIQELIDNYQLKSIKDINTAVETNKKSIEELNSKLEGNSNEPATSTTLEVVNLKIGEKLITGAGTEIILRAGNVTAIASNLGGLSDVTLAADIKQGENIQKNHLIIVPRNDGRGVCATTDAILMVRGEYIISK